MDIFVFVKRVPDTESRIRIDQKAKSIIEEGLSFVLSPYDEYAIEEAIRIRETKGGKVTAISVGPDETKTILKKCLAMGADEAILIHDDSPESYDGLRTARIIAQVVKEKFESYDLLLFGKQAVGTDNSQVPSMVAELLGLPQVNVVTKLQIEGASGTAHREIEGAMEKVLFNLPAVISAQKGLNEPRYETLKGIMMAKRKEVPAYTLQDIGISAEDIQPQIEMVGIETPPAREAGKVIDNEPEEAAKMLIEFLHNEAKII